MADVPDMTRVDAFVAQAVATGSYSFDVEHPPGLDFSKPGFKLAGVGFATEGMVFYETNLETAKEILVRLFADPIVESIAYNLKYDLKCLRGAKLIGKYQYPVNPVDPMVAVNLLDDNRRENQLGLKIVIYDQYGHTMMTFEEAWRYGPLSDKFRKYAEEDVRWEFKLWQDLKPQLEKQDLMRIFKKVYMPATKVFADMELTGCRWDIPGARKLLRGYQTMREEMKKDVLKEIGDVNLDSGDALAKRLYDELGYSTRGIEMTESGKRFSVDADAMDKLAQKYPVCAKIRFYRTATKMISTYIEPLTRAALNDENSRVHPTFWQVSTTGRTRCEKPNLQNIPAWLDKAFAHLKIRNNFVAAPGRKLIVADLSQIELRLIAHITLDTMFLKAYLEWQCTNCGSLGASDVILHSCPKCGAAENEKILKDKTIKGFFHGLDLHQMTFDAVPETGGRQGAKTANFALVYCATAYKMHFEYPELSVEEWQVIIDKFMRTYTGVKKWHVKMEAALWSNPTVTDIFGRKRRILKTDITRNPKNALNMMVNFGPQASACHMMQLGMGRFREEMVERDLWMNGVWPTNMVHDELAFEAEDELIPLAKERLEYHLEHTVQLRVPVRANAAVAESWGTAK